MPVYRRRLESAILVAFSCGTAFQEARPSAPILQRCALGTFASLGIDNTTVRTVEPLSAGAFTPPGARAPLGDLPAFCRVQGSVTTSKDSVVNFEVWVPREWNGKIVATGKGGYSNTPTYRDMVQALSQGYAAVGGDTGHQTPTPDDLLWGVDHAERIIDWGSRWHCAQSYGSYWRCARIPVGGVG